MSKRKRHIKRKPELCPSASPRTLGEAYAGNLDLLWKHLKKLPVGWGIRISAEGVPEKYRERRVLL